MQQNSELCVSVYDIKLCTLGLGVMITRSHGSITFGTLGLWPNNIAVQSARTAERIYFSL